jgi:hypothetical protein
MFMEASTAFCACFLYLEMSSSFLKILAQGFTINLLAENHSVLYWGRLGMGLFWR